MVVMKWAKRCEGRSRRTPIGTGTSLTYGDVIGALDIELEDEPES